jgi:hypothetical protein
MEAAARSCNSYKKRETWWHSHHSTIPTHPCHCLLLNRRGLVQRVRFGRRRASLHVNLSTGQTNFPQDTKTQPCKRAIHQTLLGNQRNAVCTINRQLFHWHKIQFPATLKLCFSARRSFVHFLMDNVLNGLLSPDNPTRNAAEATYQQVFFLPFFFTPIA